MARILGNMMFWRALVALVGAALAYFSGDFVDPGKVQHSVEILGAILFGSQLFPRVGDATPGKLAKDVLAGKRSTHLLVLLCVAPMLGGCGLLSSEAGKAAVPALVELAKAAAPHLRAMAARKGVEINEDLSVCLPVSDALEQSADVDLPVVAVMCIAPDVEALE